MLNVQSIARVCHEANRAYCESIGDESQKSWAASPDWQKESAIKGVEFHIANPTALPSASHESWLKVKIEDGWQYGPVKDAEKKQHPCCVDYNELPVAQRSKDYIFTAIVKELVQQHLERELQKQEDLEYVAKMSKQFDGIKDQAMSIMAKPAEVLPEGQQI